jgi:glycosyltransferase involved in cell wall biosynthesis
LENPGYGQQLTEAINSRRLSSYIEIHQDVDFCDLHTFYRNSQAFLLMSEHEGFGVPILEAQYHNLPMVALDRAAVRETLGSDQLVFSDPDPAVFAAALHRLKFDAELRKYLGRKGQENYSHYSRPQLAERFCKLVGSLPAQP